MSNMLSLASLRAIQPPWSNKWLCSRPLILLGLESLCQRCNYQVGHGKVACWCHTIAGDFCGPAIVFCGPPAIIPGSVRIWRAYSRTVCLNNSFSGKITQHQMVRMIGCWPKALHWTSCDAQWSLGSQASTWTEMGEKIYWYKITLLLATVFLSHRIKYGGYWRLVHLTPNICSISTLDSSTLLNSIHIIHSIHSIHQGITKQRERLF